MRRDQFYPQDAVERKLGRNLVQCCQRTRSFKWDCAYDILLLESLRQLLNNESILNEVIVLHTSLILALIIRHPYRVIENAI